MANPVETTQPTSRRYFNFPDMPVHKDMRPNWKIEFGGKTVPQLLAELSAHDIQVGSWAHAMFQSPDFITHENPSPISLALVKVADLGLHTMATTEQVFAAAERRGLGRVPAEVAAYLSIAYPNQPVGELIVIGMDPIVFENGTQDVFNLRRINNGQWLNHTRTGHDDGWSPGTKVVLSLPL